MHSPRPPIDFMLAPLSPIAYAIALFIYIGLVAAAVIAVPPILLLWWLRFAAEQSAT